jgi:hypothetical protein
MPVMLHQAVLIALMGSISAVHCASSNCKQPKLATSCAVPVRLKLCCAVLRRAVPCRAQVFYFKDMKEGYKANSRLMGLRGKRVRTNNITGKTVLPQLQLHNDGTAQASARSGCCCVLDDPACAVGPYSKDIA